jgi:tetrahydromethanopterin S-methyltransferase subunit B
VVTRSVTSVTPPPSCANGCPFRQHVLAAQGIISSMTYLVGFFIGAFVFQLLVAPVIFEYLL